MVRGIRRQGPALVVAVVALVVALGGSVYAATKIDGHTVKVGSLPGNRVVPRSLPANRLAPGTISANLLAPGSLTGKQVDAATLGEVPSAVHANQADSAREAGSARFATAAGSAASVNGHVAGCAPGTRAFAGGCWEVSFSAATATAAVAALVCAERGGELPGALPLLSFAQQPGIAIASEGEWTGSIAEVAGPGSYALATVLASAKISFASSTESKNYRCVYPVLG
ncbi:MAG TPA: hypothetical protein VFJ57_03655 [Solirubrobacterales bacterium]|nr:hypothetical protein [Solirubrobacterales bacterium]